MNTNEIRLINLRYLIAEHSSQKNLAIAADLPVSQISGFVNNVRAIGEKVARRMEVKLGLPLRWMDQDHSNADPILDEYRYKLGLLDPDSLAIIYASIDAAQEKNR